MAGWERLDDLGVWVEEHLVLFGGRGADGLLNDTWVWDGERWVERSPAGPVPSPRRGAAIACCDFFGRAVLFGGFGVNSVGARSRLDDTWAWDGTAWTKQLPVASPPAREAASASFNPGPRHGGSSPEIGSGEIALFGGLGVTDEPLNDTWEWSGENWYPQAPKSFSGDDPVFSGPSARYGAALVAASGGRSREAWLAGGCDGTSCGFDESGTWSYQGKGSWGNNLAGRLPGRGFPAAATDPATGGALVFGGVRGSTLLSDTWLCCWSPWGTGGQSPRPRRGAAMATHFGAHAAVLFGGEGAAGPLNDTWLWDGRRWKQLK